MLYSLLRARVSVWVFALGGETRTLGPSQAVSIRRGGSAAHGNPVLCARN